MPGKPRSPLEKIRHEAHLLREAHPRKYGRKGAKQGEPGYVYDGWKSAIADASKKLYPERHRR